MRVLLLSLVLMLAGCAPTVYRLGAGDSLVLEQRDSFVCIGSGCSVVRVWK